MKNTPKCRSKVSQIGAGSSERDLWARDPGRLLQLVYGPAPAAADCAASSAAAAAAVADDLSRRLRLAPTDATFAIAQSGFRSLPSHVVVFDVDARLPPVRVFLRAHAYTVVRRFFHAHVRGDAHAPAGAAGEPRALWVYERAGGGSNCSSASSRIQARA